MSAPTRVADAMTQAQAHELVDAAAQALGRELPGSRVELYLVDFQLLALLPVLDAGEPPVEAPHAPEARCFTLQQALTEADTAYLPVTVRGDRLGVLRATRDGGYTGDEQALLATAATLLAHLLPAANQATDRYTRASRLRRLTLAAEMQWSLLPGRCCRRPELDFAGQLEPAYAVRGDCFDWSSDPDTFTVTVTNGMGTGMEAATLTTVALTALRNARRAGAPLVDQATLADEALYSQFRGRFHVASLLFELDVRTGRMTFVEAGSPAVLRLRGDLASAVELTSNPPLGAQEGTDYVAQHVELTPGDRLVVVSDGVSELAGPDGNRYAERALRQALRRTRSMPALDTARTIIGDMLTYRGATSLDDDAVVTCLDWHGGRARP